MRLLFPSRLAACCSSQQPLSEHETEKYHADHAIHCEERCIEPREIVRLDERVLVEKEKSRHCHTSEIHDASSCAEPCNGQGNDSREVQNPRNAERVCFSESRRHGVKTILPVERDIL